jgi:hypothetical protein
MPARHDGAMAGPNGPPPNGAAPNGAPNGGPNNADHPRRGFGRMNSAGGFLLSVSVSREKMRALRQKQQRPPGQ